ncbi:DUF1281 domain-containing protein [Salmonella enterica subsp. enterica]|nr:DUF1281 domain-containing protein [Salmonella enterica subsp. enterica]MIF52442.1 DUF1281 domain-containing protein [Salmonella enterica subsp. enterica]
MPNWCANRLYFRAEPARITEIHALLEGNLQPYYRRAVQEGIQLFAAGCAGLLRSVESLHYAPFPALTAAGAGELLPENLAFTRWLSMLIDGVELDEEHCEQLHICWLDSGIGERRWEGLSAEVQEDISALYDRKYYDWSALWRKAGCDEWWNQFCDITLPEKAPPLDMLLVLPTRLDVEINGFNGKLFEGIPSAYDWYLDVFDTKWPQGHGLEIPSFGADFILADFDTPWSQPGEVVVGALSRQFGCEIEHWYAEQGCDFCGYARYVEGVQTEAFCDSLEWELADEDDEDAYSEVIGPEWLINNVAHFGG